MKKCIFCGQEVKEKTKEHVIPKWLIKLTGDLGREINLGLNYSKFLNNNEELYQSFSINSFTFPACEVCNSNYGKGLEAAAKDVVEKIIHSKDLNEGELITLLDWFDKVRIGLWIGYNTLNKNITQLDKKFHIDQRIGLYDRALIVYKFQGGKGLNFFGVNSPLFDLMPICFTLRINDFLFFNISKDQLLLKDLGFPYPDNITIHKNGVSSYSELKKGSNNISSNPLEKYNLVLSSKAIYQPLFKEFSDICRLDSDYIKSNSICQQDGVGSIFVKDEGDVKNINSIGGSYNLNPKEEYSDSNVLSKRLAYKTFHTLNISLDKLLNSNFKSEEFKNGAVEYFQPFRVIHNEMTKIIKKTMFD